MTFKQFTENTHVVALKTTGNVYSYDAIDQLCLKTKSMKDLLDDSPFTRADLITLQDPHNILARDPSTFAHISNEDVARQVDGLKSKGGAASSSSAAPVAAAAPAAAPAAAAPKPGGRRPMMGLGISLASAPSAASAAAASLSAGPARAMFSSGAVSGSFTSTAVSVATQNERALLTAEQILQQRYDHLKKTKAKGYVRLSTNLGNINLEIHCDLVPKTGHNFLELCERGYYKDTRFHRVIPGFMVQGGDPDGTGRGGAGAFEREIKDEFHPALKHDARGVLAMANSGPNTGGSQFYITFDQAKHLDGKHSVFGRVVGGSEVLDKLEQVPTVKGKNEINPKDCPVEDVLITAVTVYTNPYRAEFTPVDELTRKKEGETDASEDTKMTDEERGQWFSNPTAAALRPANSADAAFKYLSLPAPVSVDSSGASLKTTSSSKRKESPNAAVDEAALANMHPAVRAAMDTSHPGSSSSSVAAQSPMDTSMTPKPSSGSGASQSEDQDANEFEAAKRRAAQAAQGQQSGAKAASYGNFGSF